MIGPQLSRSTYVVLVSSSMVWATWRVLQWRARSRARKTVKRVRDMIPQNGPLIDYENPQICERIVKSAIRRANKWISLSDDARPMVGQVGGVSVHKRPLLTLQPDYVLKPLLTDHRGIREVAFYEAVRELSRKNPTSQSYAHFLGGTDREQSRQLSVRDVGEWLDTFAVALAMLFHDSVVTDSETAVKEAWKAVKREADALNNIAKFMAPYYGVVGQKIVSRVPTPEAPYGVTNEAHLLLQDLTVNFHKPCVMDLKLGTVTYEPDATPEKRVKEFHKYPLQLEFGLRIVGMRIFDPEHPEAGVNGFRYFGKEYGRSLSSRDQLLDAFRIFFSAGTNTNQSAIGNPHETTSDGAKSNAENADTDDRIRIRTKAVSNVLVQLRPIRRWFEENKSFRFYASSLLIVYEGDLSQGANDGVTDIKMIDFGRVRRAVGPDEGYRAGLATLKYILTELHEQEQDVTSMLETAASSVHSKSSSNSRRLPSVSPATPTRQTLS